MARLRVNEAIARMKQQGKKVLKKDLAKKIWANSSEGARSMNMTSLCSGRTQSVPYETLVILCEELECTADFLYGLTDE